MSFTGRLKCVAGFHEWKEDIPREGPLIVTLFDKKGKPIAGNLFERCVHCPNWRIVDVSKKKAA